MGDSPMNIGECMYNASMSHGAPDKDICGTINKHDWFDGTPELMKSALLEKGPLAVGIFVGDGFVNYESGVLRLADAAADCPDLQEIGINHAVTAVGYGEEDIKARRYRTGSSETVGVKTGATPGISRSKWAATFVELRETYSLLI